MAQVSSLSTLIQTLGGPAYLARRLGIRSQAISQWIARGRIPAARVFAVAAIAQEQQMNVSPADLRPDLALG